MSTNNKILDLVNEASKKQRIMDLNNIEKIIDINIESKGLEEQLKGTDIRPEIKIKHDEITLANYNPEKKKIEIFLRSLWMLLKKQEQDLYKFPVSEMCFYQNFAITRILQHETEHANQQKLLEQVRGGGIDFELLNLCFWQPNKMFMLRKMLRGQSIAQIQELITQKQEKIRKAYKQYYRFSLEERLANIQAYQENIQMMSRIESTVPNVLREEKRRLQIEKMKGYDEVFSPTLFYFRNAGLAEELRSFKWYTENDKKCLENLQSTYSLEERLLYGLPISEEEYQTLVRK